MGVFTLKFIGVTVTVTFLMGIIMSMDQNMNIAMIKDVIEQCMNMHTTSKHGV